MFHCSRCGVRFSRGALSGLSDCPRCKTRDGISVQLRWESASPRVKDGQLATIRAQPEHR